MPAPEEKARQKIDEMLTKAGWVIQDYKEANINAVRGVVLRNFPLASGHGFADYLLYLDGKAARIIEAKKEGFPSSASKSRLPEYSEGLPPHLPAYVRPLPFLYQSTGIETRFTNGLDPEPRSRGVFAFHKPETLIGWLDQTGLAEEPVQPGMAAYRGPQYRKIVTLRGRLRQLPHSNPKVFGPRRSRPSPISKNRSPKIVPAPSSRWPPAPARPSPPSTSSTASSNSPEPSASCSSWIAATSATRHSRNSSSSSRPTTTSSSPKSSSSSTSRSNQLDTSARVSIGTIQRLYSMLRGERLAEDDEEASRRRP